MDMLASDCASTPETLRARHHALTAAGSRMRMRDAAEALGVAEGVLLAAYVGQTVTALKPDFTAILSAVGSLGRVMALTRNDHCVHERKGVYRNMSFNGGIGLAVDKDIDLRLFMTGWSSAFAQVEPREGGVARSLQFFDTQGEAIHKIHLLPDSDVAAFDRLVSEFAALEQQAELAVAADAVDASLEEDDPTAMPAGFDVSPFCADWDALKDTHDFFPLLRRYGLTRLAAFRAAGPARATRVERLAHRAVLAAAQATGMPIMAFVGNRGCIQIHTGPVSNLKQMGDWFNVLDPEFNLHLLESGIVETWLVRKPTVDGMVTSIELFDAAGRPLLMLFGARKPGIAENLEWRAIAEATGVAA